MARHFAQSLKGKIWLATGAFSCFVFIFGIGSYLFTSLFVENSIYAVAFRFVLLALSVIIYGWWLSNEVVKPI
jgi:hypothetical protein